MTGFTVAEVVGAANFFDVTLDAGGVATDGSGATFRSALVPTGTGSVRAMIRPDRLLIGPDTGGSQAANTLRGTVRQRLFMGGYYEYVVETAAGSPRVLSSREFAEQSKVVLSFEAADCIFLPRDQTWESPPN